MGWRFRKSFKVAPGVRMNLGSRGVASLSVGGRGARINFGKRGVTGTLSVPGTGLSYQQRLGRPPKGAAPGRNAQAVQATLLPGHGATTKRGKPQSTYLVLAAAAFVGFLIVHGFGQSPVVPQAATASEPTVPALPIVGPGPAVAAPLGAVPVPEQAEQPSRAPAPSRSGPAVRFGGQEATAIQAANLRSAPSVSGSVVGTLGRGAPARVLEAEGNWLRVGGSNGEALGWVHASLLR